MRESQWSYPSEGSTGSGGCQALGQVIHFPKCKCLFVQLERMVTWSSTLITWSTLYVRRRQKCIYIFHVLYGNNLGNWWYRCKPCMKRSSQELKLSPFYYGIETVAESLQGISKSSLLKCCIKKHLMPQSTWCIFCIVWIRISHLSVGQYQMHKNNLQGQVDKCLSI